MSDVWKNFANKSPQAEKDSKTSPASIFLVAACLGGVFADAIIVHRETALAVGVLGSRRGLVRLWLRAAALGAARRGADHRRGDVWADRPGDVGQHDRRSREAEHHRRGAASGPGQEEEQESAG